MLVKRVFDILFSILCIITLFVILISSYILASIDTNSNGLFFQERIGQFGRKFLIFKLKTVHPITRKISSFGAFLRKYKLDELPQLFNVFFGEMSFVGPRPDIPGYYDTLQGEDRKILNLKPGITSEASIKYRNEESILKRQSNPLKYNDKVIFPDKVKMNLNYYYNNSFAGDLKIILKTFLK